MRQRTTLRDSLLEELFKGTEQEPDPGSKGGGRRLLTGVEPPPAVRTIRRLTAALVAVAAVAVAALGVSVWQLVRDEASTVVVTEAASPAPPVARQAAAPPVERSTSVSSRAVAVSPARLTLAAVRGDCWLEVRSGSASGRVLHAGTLAQGASRTFAGHRLWVAFGAGGHLDVTLNGRGVGSFPTGTAAVVVTAGGIGPPGPV